MESLAPHPTALRAFEDSMDDDTDSLLRMEVADLNQVVPSLQDPALAPDIPEEARSMTGAERREFDGIARQFEKPITPEGAAHLTMTKSYLSGRRCCDFTIADDDRETHEEGCPWSLVNKFAKDVRRHYDSWAAAPDWLVELVLGLEEDMCNSPIRAVPEEAREEPKDVQPWKPPPKPADAQCTGCTVDQPYPPTTKAQGVLCGGCGRSRPSRVYFAHPVDVPEGPWEVQEAFVGVGGKREWVVHNPYGATLCMHQGYMDEEMAQGFRDFLNRLEGEKP